MPDGPVFTLLAPMADSLMFNKTDIETGVLKLPELSVLVKVNWRVQFVPSV